MSKHSRAILSHFTCILSHEYLSIKASASLHTKKGEQHKRPLLESWTEEEFAPSAPWETLGPLMKKNNFEILVQFYHKGKRILERSYESDSIGNFFIQIPNSIFDARPEYVAVYEVSMMQGVWQHLGTFIPLVIQQDHKILISDFDKTLVDTRYSSTREVYRSLTSPLERFPTIEKSVELFKNFLSDGHQSFVLTASPHFYEQAISDWFVQNKIYTASIFLKDYRNAFSWKEAGLAPKDIKAQGFYKLDGIITILLMTGMPRKLILMGDNYESDPVIYLAITSILRDEKDPWQVWKELKYHSAFKFTKRQNTLFLGKMYKIKGLLEHGHRPEVKIYIRKFFPEEREVNIDILKDYIPFIEYYEG